jgi:hypothetical protein
MFRLLVLYLGLSLGIILGLLASVRLCVGLGRNPRLILGLDFGLSLGLIIVRGFIEELTDCSMSCFKVH